MKLTDPNCRDLELVETEDEGDSIAGIVIVVFTGEASVEVLITEDELKKMHKWAKTGNRPK